LPMLLTSDTRASFKSKDIGTLHGHFRRKAITTQNKEGGKQL